MTSNRLRELREQAGLSMQALAARVGTSAPQINKLEKGERRLTLDWMARLAQALGVDLAELLPVPQPPSAGPEPFPSEDHIRMGPAPSPIDPRDLIPVRSAARGGDEQEMFLKDGPIDFIGRPQALLRVRDAYTIYMVGDSMFPRYRQGQLLHVNPHKPPQPGAGVVVTKTNDAVLIKEFRRRSGSVLYLHQYNPVGPVEIPLASIRDLHTVVGLDEA